MVRSSTHGEEKSHRRVDVQNAMNTHAYIYKCMCTCICFHTKFTEIGTIRRSPYDPTREIILKTAKCMHSAPCDLLLHTASCLHPRGRLCHKGMHACVCVCVCVCTRGRVYTNTCTSLSLFFSRSLSLHFLCMQMYTYADIIIHRYIQ